jgi:hypothetical protein
MGRNAWLIVFLLFVPAFSGPAGAQVEITRSPPGIQARAGGHIDVTLMVSVSGFQEGVIITESVPAGWKVSGASPPPDKKAGNEVKWLFTSRSGISSAEISYVLQIPGSASGLYQLSGHWKSIDSTGEKHEGVTEAGTIHIVSPSASPGGGGGGGGSGAENIPFRVSGNDKKEETTCTEGRRRCAGMDVMACSGGKWVLNEKCEFGCRSGQCLAGENKSVPEDVPERGGIEITGSFLSGASFITGAAVLAIAVALVLMKRKPKKTKKWRYEFRPRESPLQCFHFSPAAGFQNSGFHC